MGRQKKTTSEPYQIRISENALKNIDEITGYIAFIKHEPMSAIKVGDAILRQSKGLDNFRMLSGNAKNLLQSQNYTAGQFACLGLSFTRLKKRKFWSWALCTVHESHPL